MAFIIKDRVKEGTVTTGTGAFALGGAASTFEAFNTYMSNGDTAYYAVVHTASGIDEWEIGLGTFNTGNTLTRTTILSSSNSGNAVNFSSGTKDIFMTYPADRAVIEEPDRSVSFPAGISVTGNVAASGTIDGRDVAADGTKLDGIETAATADQTAAEIRTLVESATDSNVFTDADHSKLNAIEASATADQTASEIRALVESASDSNVFTDADHTKLNAIEAGATADQTKSDIDALNIDADTLDGSHASAFATAAQGTTANNALPKAGGTMTGDIDGNGNKVLFANVYSTEGDLPSASTYHGMFAHVHGTGAGYFAHAGSWVKLANDSQISDENFTTADHSKLDGIEASADVTDTANVTSAGALMDSEVTNLAQVKAFDSSDYATAAQGTTANNALPKAGGAMTGAITTNSTFDGRDVATDGTKLDGIEAGATADQTASEIRALVESASDSNVFTDADHTKLNAIEASADVTDTANVVAALIAGTNITINQDGNNFIISSSASGGGSVPAGTISGSAQITALGFTSGSHTTLPSGTVSGSSQLTSSYDSRYLQTSTYTTDSASFDTRISNIGDHANISHLNAFTQSAGVRLDSIETFTSSIDTTIKTKLNTDDVLSGSIESLLPSGVISGSTQITDGSGIVSGSVIRTLGGIKILPLQSNTNGNPPNYVAPGWGSSLFLGEWGWGNQAWNNQLTKRLSQRTVGQNFPGSGNVYCNTIRQNIIYSSLNAQGPTFNQGYQGYASTPPYYNQGDIRYIFISPNNGSNNFCSLSSSWIFRF